MKTSRQPARPYVEAKDGGKSWYRDGGGGGGGGVSGPSAGVHGGGGGGAGRGGTGVTMPEFLRRSVRAEAQVTEHTSG